MWLFVGIVNFIIKQFLNEDCWLRTFVDVGLVDWDAVCSCGLRWNTLSPTSSLKWKDAFCYLQVHSVWQRWRFRRRENVKSQKRLFSSRRQSVCKSGPVVSSAQAQHISHSVICLRRSPLSLQVRWTHPSYQLSLITFPWFSSVIPSNISLLFRHALK
jgi:hypothetical protein